MMWIDEFNDIIKNCGKLSTLGIQKSFSTSDIAKLSARKTTETNIIRNGHHAMSLRHTVSELTLNPIQRCGYLLESSVLSRSCSTWVQVAVGELASTSQLPSPHGHCTSLTISSSQQQINASNLIGSSPINASQPFTSTDLIKSVNKKDRETYIRSRLLTTSRAIERLSQSEFNLDQLASVATTSIPINETGSGPGPIELIVPSVFNTNKDKNTGNIKPSATQSELAPTTDTISALTNTSTSTSASPKKISISNSQKFTRNLTIQDIEKERGRPLSKYDRNMMIFNWLHSLDETSTVEDN